MSLFQSAFIHVHPWFLFTLMVSPLGAQTTVPAALEKSRTDLTATLSSLEKSRAAIAAEKPALSAEFVKTEMQLGEKRRLVRIARLSKDDRAQELRQLQSDLATRRQDATYLASLLKDHALKTSTLATPGTPALELSPEILAAETNVPAESITARLPILDAAITQMEALLAVCRT